MTLILIILVAIALYMAYDWTVKSIMKPSKDYPTIQKLVSNKKIIVCAGDSITHGNMSYDWVKDLSTQLPDYQVFNAGINADLSYTLLNRLDDIIAVKPHHINILIGTNDIVAQSRPLKKSDRYIQFKKIPWGTQPSIASYAENLRTIVAKLKQETQATISLMSIPPIGEDITSPIYKTVEKYNVVVKSVANTEGVVYVPLHETLHNYLVQNNAQSAIPFEKTIDYTTKSAYLNIFLRWDWDKITQFHKHLLTFDNLHFNSVGGKMMAKLIVSIL